MINPRTIAQDLIDIAFCYMGERATAAEMDADPRIKRARQFLERPNRNPGWDIPKDGAEAFHRGASDALNPFPVATVDWMRWHAAWWSANADAYEDHINGALGHHGPKDRDRTP